MDKKWELEDLYEFPHAYSQSHSLIYCFDSKLNPRDRERINIALTEYSWQGGYSYVNFYTVLRHQVPVEYQPQIASIHYASPGWIDIILNPNVAIQVAKSVSILLGTAVAASKAYTRIYKELAALKKEKIKNQAEKAEFSQREIKAVMEMADEIAKYIGFNSVAQLQDYTKNAEVTLKILLAHYRRIRIMADYVEKGKVTLPIELKKPSKHL